MVTQVSAQARASETTILDTIELSRTLIRYDGNGNDGGAALVDSVRYAAGDTVKLSSDTMNLSRSCFSFVGWNPRSDGSGTTFEPAALYL